MASLWYHPSKTQMSALSELYHEIELCQDCELARYRNRVVPGEGAENARIMFIGEAPGFYEDQQGRPFVGAAGHFLDELLTSIGLKRSEVYICNMLKCRPPENRDPLPQEINACQKWLDRQIELISPRVIVPLGRHALARFFPRESIGKIHGTWQKQGGVIYFAMYHPAAALHQQSLRRTIEADFQKLPQLLAQADEIAEKPSQLTMF
jgi:uracil-DNA glycosylase family 4